LVVLVAAFEVALEALAFEPWGLLPAEPDLLLVAIPSRFPFELE